MTIPHQQIRAVYNDSTIRAYQAYNDAIPPSLNGKIEVDEPPISHS